jgi:hypothetical protein
MKTEIIQTIALIEGILLAVCIALLLRARWWIRIKDGALSNYAEREKEQIRMKIRQEHLDKMRREQNLAAATDSAAADNFVPSTEGDAAADRDASLRPENSAAVITGKNDEAIRESAGDNVAPPDEADGNITNQQTLLNR